MLAQSVCSISVDSPHLRHAASYGVITPSLVQELRSLLPQPDDQIAYSPSNSPTPKSMIRFMKDKSHHMPGIPSVVVSCLSTQQVSDVLRFCNKNKIVVSPSGTRTGLEGGSIPWPGSLVLDLSRMNKILKEYPEEQLITVQPGIYKSKLNKYLNQKGLFFPVDPGSNACLGGYASTGASGTLACKYGTMRENVTTMEVVLADGRILRTRARVKKSSVGYNLNQLMIGAEGTLGVITELTVRTRRLPQFVVSARVTFPDCASAAETVAALSAADIQVARAELLNPLMIQGTNALNQTNDPLEATLLLEFHSRTLNAGQSDAKQARQIAREKGSTSWTAVSDPKAINKMWAVRRSAYFAGFKLRPGLKNVRLLSTDVCVPIPHLAKVIADTEADFKSKNQPCPIVGHVADGNFHCLLPFISTDEKEVAIVEELTHNLSMRAISVNGTCSGEHGVGVGKIAGLIEERGPVGVAIMQAIKKAMDPNMILNPGKVFPLPDPPRSCL